MMFSSIQTKSRFDVKSPLGGVERIMYFDSSGAGDRITFREYQLDQNLSLAPISSAQHSVRLIGADRHWDSDSLYVTTGGMPVIYSMESASGHNGVLFQAYDPRNIPRR